MKIKINGYVVARVYTWRDEPEFTWYEHDPSDILDGCIVLGRKEIEFEVPDDFNLQAAKIAALENEAEKARAEFHKRITEIEDQISKLTAIEYNHD